MNKILVIGFKGMYNSSKCWLTYFVIIRTDQVFLSDAL